jgi:hypothetical protein
MTKQQLAYWAGLVDGEGSVGYHSHGRDAPKHFVIEVKMSTRHLIEGLHNDFGGYFQEMGRAKPHYKDLFRWRVSGSKARVVYSKLRPFLRLKFDPKEGA